MIENKLKNPVWFSLQETHHKFITSFEGVHFYNPTICPFGAFEEVKHTKNALNEYAKLTDSFFLVSEKDIPIFDENYVELEKKINGCQMVLNQLQPTSYTEEIIKLTEEHVDEIYDLVWLVMPGYYRKRTFDMGDYYGIFKDGKLVSITGQRMQTTDFIEVSAVVTHPDYTKRGYAKQLVHFVTNEIIKVNKLPILHTNKGNPAIGLYQKLGYKLTRDMNWWLFRKK